MSDSLAWHINLIAWYVFAAYWFVSAIGGKRTKAAEKSSDRLITLAAMVVAFVLLFSEFRSEGRLRLRFLPAEPWIAWLGVAITWVGIAIAIWARRFIGQYWSARVTLKEDHQLIRTGPYRYVRHPIYTGMLVGAIGTAVTIGEWRGVVAVVLILWAHSLKAMREERMLGGEFGQEYEAYRRTTGFLFPRLSRGTDSGSGMDTRAGRT